MRKALLFVITLLPFISGFAQQRLTFKISKPLCLLTFLQAASGTGHVAPSLTEFIRKNIANEDSAAFNHLVIEFSHIGFDYSYVFRGYPEKRQHPKTVINLVTMAAVHSATITEFMGRIVGMLPNEQWMKLNNVLVETEPYYDKLISRPYNDDIQHQLSEFEKFNTGADSIFNKLKHFYASTWGDDMPFTISIYPVPGERGGTTATPHSNSLVLAALTGEKNYTFKVGVAIHEICHVLYEEQPLALQQKMDSCFLLNNSVYSQYAYSYIDEALATACGNGWAYKTLSGHLEKGAWYNDDYIDGYAHAIYPLVADYMEHDKALDSAFINKAITLFGETFPDAIYDYKGLLNTVHLYTDAEDHEQYGQINSVTGKYFMISSCAGSYPISCPQSIDMITESAGTQFFIVHTLHDKNFGLLKDKFPQLKDIRADAEGISSFIDDKKRPVIIINVRDISRLEAGVKALAKNKKINPAQIFTPIE